MGNGTTHQRCMATLAALLALAASALCVWPAMAKASLSGTDGSLAWTQQGSLVVGQSDGSGVHVLVEGLGQNPSWSQTGELIAFGGGGQIWLVHANGSDPHPVTNNTGPGVYADEPAFSPDGRIAYVANAHPGSPLLRRIVLIDPDGSHAVTVSRSVSAPSSPSWSGDGDLYFLGWSNGIEYLYRVRADGSGRRRFPVPEVASMSISADGKVIAFDRNNGLDQVWLASLRDLRTGVSIGVSVGVGTHPDLSPSGERLALTEATSVDSDNAWLGSQLAVYGTDGSTLSESWPGTVIDQDSSADGIAWQPRCTMTVERSHGVVTGTAGSDVICLLGNNDTVRGRGGNDVIYITGRNNRVYGGRGRDVVVVRRGSNKLWGGRGADLFNTRDSTGGRSEILGGRGRDICLTKPIDVRLSCSP